MRLTITVLKHMRRPTGGQLAVAGIFGLVFGALGEGFARALGLFLAICAVFGIWHIATLLAELVAMRKEQIERPRGRAHVGGHS